MCRYVFEMGGVSKSFRCTLEVRDYELDSQGIVNNAVYLNYLEHARHLFLRETGQEFNDWHKKGIDPVVRRLEIEYRQSLQGGDQFEIETWVEQKGYVRFLFHQRIVRGDEEVLTAVITVVFVRNGRPVQPPQEMVDALREFSKQE